MTASPTLVFYNPAAGHGRGMHRISQVSAALTRHGLPHRLVPSRAPGDIERQVRQAVDDGQTRIVVAGGDGSVHEAANGLLQANRKAAMGVIPLGSGNDFAKACSIPLDIENASALLADRMVGGVPTRPIDVGSMNERFFVNGAGIGFDARVSAIAGRIRLPVGDLVYLLAMLRALVSGTQPAPLSVEHNGNTVRGPTTLVSISNGAWVGGMFQIAPMAKNDDGKLDLVVVQALSRRGVLRLLPLLLEGRHMTRPEVRHAEIERCVVQADSALPSHLDGENQPPASHFDIRLVPSALELL